jgi:DNA-binding CsgD family transcriptional regulator
MTRRGRRPHPDILTPREWEVLTLLREGASNPQIAERLSVTRDAVKYHVSEILSKLGLASREEAAAWQPEPSARPVLRPAWARALGPIAGLWRAWPIAVRIAGAAFVAAAMGALGVLAYGLARSNGDTSDDIAQATVSASASTAPHEVRVQPGDTIRVLTYGSPPTDITTCEEQFTFLDVKPNDAQKNPVTCTIGLEAPRLTFVDVGNEVLQLSSVELVLLGTQGPPASPQNTASGPSTNGEDNCSAISTFLFDGRQDPATAPLQIACRIPLAETRTDSTKTVWAHVNATASVPMGPQPCWLLAPAAGGVGDGPAQKPVQCLLNVAGEPTTSPTALTVLPAIALPPALDVIMEIGCCETDLTGLIRYSRTSEGLGVPAQGHRDVLFSAGSHSFITADGSAASRDEYQANGIVIPTPNPQAPSKAPAEDRPYVATYGVSSDAQAMVVGLCIRGACEGVNAAPNDQGITQLYRSLDGGDTWSELEQLGPYLRVVGVTRAGRILVATGAPDSKEETYSWEPDHEPVTPPVPFSETPTVLEDGRVIWPSQGNWYLQDGSILARHVPGTGFFFPIIDMGGSEFAISGTGTAEGGSLTMVSNGAEAASYTVPGLFNVGAYLGNGVFAALVSMPVPAGAGTTGGEVPALIDINARTVTPITSPFLDVGFDQPGFLILVGATQLTL